MTSHECRADKNGKELHEGDVVNCRLGGGDQRFICKNPETGKYFLSSPFLSNDILDWKSEDVQWVVSQRKDMGY